VAGGAKTAVAAAVGGGWRRLVQVVAEDGRRAAVMSCRASAARTWKHAARRREPCAVGHRRSDVGRRRADALARYLRSADEAVARGARAIGTVVLTPATVSRTASVSRVLNQHPGKMFFSRRLREIDPRLAGSSLGSATNFAEPPSKQMGGA